jgi:hypothetical protein
MSNDWSGPNGHHEKDTLLTNPDYRATMCPISKKETPGWWIYPAATLLYEDYLGFIARYNIE